MPVKRLTAHALMKLRSRPPTGKTRDLATQLDKNEILFSRINKALVESERLASTLLSVFDARTESDRANAMRLNCRIVSGATKQNVVEVSIPFLVVLLEQRLFYIMDQINELRTTNDQTYIVFVPGVTTDGTPQTTETTTGKARRTRRTSRGK